MQGGSISRSPAEQGRFFFSKFKMANTMSEPVSLELFEGDINLKSHKGSLFCHHDISSWCVRYGVPVELS